MQASRRVEPKYRNWGTTITPSTRATPQSLLQLRFAHYLPAAPETERPHTGSISARHYTLLHSFYTIQEPDVGSRGTGGRIIRIIPTFSTAPEANRVLHEGSIRRKRSAIALWRESAYVSPTKKPRVRTYHQKVFRTYRMSKIPLSVRDGCHCSKPPNDFSPSVGWRCPLRFRYFPKVNLPIPGCIPVDMEFEDLPPLSSSTLPAALMGSPPCKRQCLL